MVLKRPQIQASFPKAILVVSVVCGVLMVKFKHPHANYAHKVHPRKLQSATLGMPHVVTESPETKKETAAGLKPDLAKEPSVAKQIQSTKKFGPQLEEDFNRVAISTPNTQVVAKKGDDKFPTKECKDIFAQLSKGSLKENTEVKNQTKENLVKEELKKAKAEVIFQKVTTKANTASVVTEVPTQKFEKRERMVSLVIRPRSKYPALAVRTKKKELIAKVSVEIAKKEVVNEPEPTWTDAAFDEINEETSLEEDLASELNSTAPIDEFVALSFNEPSLGDAYNEDNRMALVQIESAKDPLASLKDEQKMLIIEGTFEKIDFVDLAKSIALIKENGEKIGEVKAAPLPKLAWNDLPAEPAEPVLVSPSSKSEVNTQTQVATNAPALVGTDAIIQRNETQNEPTKVTPQSSEEGNRETVPTPGEFIEEEDEPTIVKMLHKHALNASPKLGSTGEFKLSSQPRSETSVTTSEATTQTNSKFIPPPTPDAGGTIHGRLTADTSFLSWLDSIKGHVELHLKAVGSNNPDDTIILHQYYYPEKGENFEINARNLEGKYQLIAAVQTNTSAIPVALIPYSKLISAADYKENIFFQLKKENNDRNPASRESNKGTVILNLTLFEGASGNHRQPKNLKSGEITVVGLPEWGSFKADKEGNIRIPNLPASSEIIIEAKAPGYYDTRQVIPTFSTDVYTPVYLIQKDKVETITKFFTKREQAPSKSILMGRIFDTESRTPLADQEVSLSFRKGSALYFDVFPDPKLKATKTSGLYGFFNVEPSFRSVYHSGSRHSLLMNIEPNLGYYVETGRGGSRGLKISLRDPFANRAVEAKVHLVGDDLAESHTDQKGKAKFEGIDLSPGVITIETEAEGYPTTWHTIPWSTREPERERTLYMMEKDMVLESAITIARVKRTKYRGALVGGAHASLFKKGRQKIQIELYATNGSKVSEESGPFPLTNAKFNPHESLSLTRENPGFTFFNLLPGEYLLKWMDENHKTFRTHVVRVGVDRLSVVVN